MDKYKSNQPNAAKLVSSLRSTGYDSYSAIEDIVDNSIDAGARNISILVSTTDGELGIMIADDGHGMDEHILDQALKLGSDTEKNDLSDLGKFGMGLCTASISLSRKLEVITKTKGGSVLYSCQDLDLIAELNDFRKIGPEMANDSQVELFEQLVSGENGTVVVLSKIDRISDSNTSQFANKLSRDLGRIYRKFIDSGIRFEVNNKKIEANDPLWTDNEMTQIYSDELYELPTSLTRGGRVKKIRIKIALLPDLNPEQSKSAGINLTNQGFYVLRNNREIAHGVTLGIFSRHNDFNRLRIELEFDAELDEVMGVTFSKDGIKPNQTVSDFLKQEIGGQISSIRKSTVKTKKVSDESKVDHAGSESIIAQKAKLLITPEAEIEKRGPRINSGDREMKDSESQIDRSNYRETKTSPKGIGARFDTASMGREGVLYETYQEGKVIVVRWNIDHPFYERVLMTNRDSKDIVSAIDYLVFALASAELKNVNEESVELMASLKSIMSSNLRVLLS